VLFVAMVVTVLAGMLVCYGRSAFARLLIVAAAIIVVSVGIGSVYAALNDRPWEYVSFPGACSCYERSLGPSGRFPARNHDNARAIRNPSVDGAETRLE
jgi:hypothetical protein